MKEEYASQECAVCSAPADGLHYGAISCRSCNAFFRRTVVEKAEYRCKHNNNCIIDPDGRCACRSCRFSKCIEAGMKVSSVQPRRDPTGSQKERRKRTTNPSSSSSPLGNTNNSFSNDQTSSGSFIIDAIKMNYNFSTPRRYSNDWYFSPEKVKIEVDDEQDQDQVPSTSESEKVSRLNTPNVDDQQEFRYLVYAFGEHQRMMQLSFSTFDQFLKEVDDGPTLRPMEATDVSKLSSVELTGLLYWIEKLRPYRDLPSEDRSVLLKRYSVRKLSLDHFYSASKHPDKCKNGDFVMNNYTFVPADKTGFELPDDDQRQIEAKQQTFAPTFARFWTNVIRPFVKLRVTDAEIVYLQIMLLWSQTNNEHVSAPTKTIMKQRRDWAMCRLFDWYHEHGVEDPGLRFGQITLILGEVEMICDMHCQDFQVAKLFDFCDMSKFWYESLCYASCNTNNVQYDPNLFENLKTFTALSVIETHGMKLPVDESPTKWQKLNNFSEPHYGEKTSLLETNGYQENITTNQSFDDQTMDEDVSIINENRTAKRTDRKASSSSVEMIHDESQLMMMDANNIHGEPLGIHNENGFEYHRNEMMFNQSSQNVA